MENQLENQIESQINLQKDGIQEVFVNQNDYLNYMGCSPVAKPMIQKMYVVIFNGKCTFTIFTAKSKAIAEFLDLNEVSSFEELEAK